MNHRIAAGFFDNERLLVDGELAVVKRLDDDVVEHLLGRTVALSVEAMDDGYVVCDWLSTGVNRACVKFLFELWRATECDLVDTSSRTRLTIEELQTSVELFDRR